MSYYLIICSLKFEPSVVHVELSGQVKMIDLRPYTVDGQNPKISSPFDWPGVWLMNAHWPVGPLFIKIKSCLLVINKGLMGVSALH